MTNDRHIPSLPAKPVASLMGIDAEWANEADFRNPFPANPVVSLDGEAYEELLDRSNILTLEVEHHRFTRNLIFKYIARYFELTGADRGVAFGIEGDFGSGKSHFLRNIIQDVKEAITGIARSNDDRMKFGLTKENSNPIAFQIYVKIENSDFLDLYRRIVSQVSHSTMRDLDVRIFARFVQEKVAGSEFGSLIEATLQQNPLHVEHLFKTAIVSKSEIRRMYTKWTQSITVDRDFAQALLYISSPHLEKEAYDWLVGREIRPEAMQQLGVSRLIVTQDQARLALRLIINLFEMARVPLFLYIDQIERLVLDIDLDVATKNKGFLHSLAEWCSREGAFLCLSGVSDAWRELPEDFFARLNFQLLWMQPLNYEEAIQLLEVYLQQNSTSPSDDRFGDRRIVEFSPEAIEELVRLSKGNIRQFLRRAHVVYEQYVIKEKKRGIDEKDVFALELQNIITQNTSVTLSDILHTFQYPDGVISSLALGIPPEQIEAVTRKVQALQETDEVNEEVYLNAALLLQKLAHPTISLDINVKETGKSYTINLASNRELEINDKKIIRHMIQTGEAQTSTRGMEYLMHRPGAIYYIGAGNLSVKDAGKLLFDDIFGDADILGVFREGYAEANAVHSRLCLNLSLPRSLLSLPWELLYDFQENTFLACDSSISFVRVFGEATYIATTPIQDGVSIVAVLADPNQRSNGEANNYLGPLNNLVSQVNASGVAIGLETIAGPGTWDQLVERLQSSEPIHVLCLFCYTSFSDQADTANFDCQILLEDHEGGDHNVSLAAVRDLLSTYSRSIRMVCLTPLFVQNVRSEDPRGDPACFAGEYLLSSGLPVVLAVRSGLPIEIAASMMSSFFERVVVDQQPIDRALTEVRVALREKHPVLPYWAWPVLFAHKNAQYILNRSSSPVQAHSSNSEPSGFLPPQTPVLDQPMVPRTSAEVRYAKDAIKARNWRQAVILFERIQQRFRLPDDIQMLVDLAKRELQRESILTVVDHLERQERWLEVIEQLIDYHQHFPEEMQKRLAVAQKRQQITGVVIETVSLAGKRDWEAVIQRIETIEAEDTDYLKKRKDIQILRQEAISEFHFDRTGIIENTDEKSVILEKIEQLPTEYFSDDLRDLQRSIRKGIEKQEAEQRLRIVREVKSYVYENAHDKVFELIKDNRNDVNIIPDLQAILAELIESPQAPLGIRLQAANQAAVLGDIRSGVCRMPLRMINLIGDAFQIGNTSEEIQRVYEVFQREQQEQPQGPAPVHWNDQENQHLINVPGFAISRYPITNGLFQLFIEEEGYNPDQPWWQGDHRTWLVKEGVDRPAYWHDPRLGRQRPNYPVVGVSWFEAQAFCAWLTQHLKYNPERAIYRLPAEWEWEFAARGAQRWMYPWGDEEPSRDLANFNLEFGTTTPVGCFIDGYTPTGLADMAGNVWEWTGSIYQPYPIQLQNSHRLLKNEEHTQIVVRGGGWASQKHALRTTQRHHYQPSEMWRYLGFRVVMDEV